MVVADAGRLGVPRMLVIADATGGLPVRLAAGMTLPARGTQVVVHGTVAAPYGQTELRVIAGGLTVLGTAATPPATRIAVGALGEATEGRLVTVHGTVTASAVRSTGGDLVLTIRGDDGRNARVYADASAGLVAAQLRKGTIATFTGIVGQRATRKGALDGYRLWLRDRADLAVTVAAPAGSGGSGTPGGSGGSGGASAGAGLSGAARLAAMVIDVDLADVGAHLGARIRVGGRVTALRPDGVDIDDGTGSLPLVLTGDAADELGLLEPGEILNATGIPERRGALVVVVRAPADLVLVGDLGAVPDPADTAEDGSPSAASPDTSPAPTTSLRAGVATGVAPDPAAAGLGTLLLGIVTSVVVAGARRLRSRRLVNARILARLVRYGAVAQATAVGRDG